MVGNNSGCFTACNIPEDSNLAGGTTIINEWGCYYVTFAGVRELALPLANFLVINNSFNFTFLTWFVKAVQVFVAGQAFPLAEFLGHPGVHQPYLVVQPGD